MSQGHYCYFSLKFDRECKMSKSDSYKVQFVELLEINV